jgi:NAD(P)H dehydrogenase (quinone)
MTAARRIAILLAHPNDKSLSAAISSTYCQAAKSAGHEVRVIDLYALKFDPVLRFSESGFPTPLEADLQLAQQTITWCEHLVIVFPVWWFGLPALLKGFIDRTFTEGWAYQFTSAIHWQKLLKGRSAHAIYTMDTPPLFARVLIGDAFGAALRRGTLKFVGFHPIKMTAFGPVKTSTDDIRLAWLKKITRYGSLGI